MEGVVEAGDGEAVGKEMGEVEGVDGWFQVG